MIATAFTWSLLEGKPPGHEIVFRIWYSALTLALGAIGTAAQQAVKLARLSAYPDCRQHTCKMLGVCEGGRWRSWNLQLFIWQTPVMLQNGSIYLFLAGLVYLV